MKIQCNAVSAIPFVILFVGLVLSSPAIGQEPADKEKPADKENPDRESDQGRAEFEKLKAELEGETDAAARFVLIQKFGTYPTTETVPFLTQLMEGEKNPEITCVVISALWKVGTREAVEAVVTRAIPLLGGEFESYLFEPVTALHSKIDDEAEDWLISNGVTPEVRKNTGALMFMIGVLGSLRSEKTTEVLVQVMKDQRDLGVISATVIKALGRIGTKGSVEAIVTVGIPLLLGDETFLPSVEMALKNKLTDEAEDWLLKYGLSAQVRKDPAAMKHMLTVLAFLRSEKKTKLLQTELKRSTDSAAKIAILRAFRASPPENVDRVVYPSLRDKDPRVQVAALQVLLEVKSAKYTRDYLRLLKSSHWEVRAMGIDLLLMARYRSMVRHFIPLLKDPEFRVKVVAIKALTAAGGDDVIKPLIDAMDDNKGRVLDDLADALARLTGKDLGIHSVQWDSWWANNKGKVDIEKLSPRDFTQLKTPKAGEVALTSTGYFGLRVISENVAFVFDSSNSMAEKYLAPEGEAEGAISTPGIVSKMDVAKGELNKVIEHLSLGVKLNIIRFNSMVEPFQSSLIELDLTSKDGLLKYVEASQPGGLTNMYGAIEEAFRDERVDTIYLLSDGAPTMGAHVKAGPFLAALEEMNEMRKIKINTIGFSLQPEEVFLMQSVADQNYGVFIPR